MSSEILVGNVAPVNSEMWKPYPGNPNYWISDLGRALSLKRKKVRILKPQLNEDGYPHIILCWRDGRQRTRKLPSLVLETFVGPKPEGLICCHRDGVRTNNFLGNLVWDTYSRNTQDIYLHGNENPPRGDRNGMARLTESIVREIRRLARDGWTATMIEASFPVSRRHASDIISGRAWKHLDQVQSEGCGV